MGSLHLLPTGCRFLHSIADFDADYVLSSIVLPFYASIIMSPYNYADFDSNFGIVLRICMRNAKFYIIRPSLAFAKS